MGIWPCCGDSWALEAAVSLGGVVAVALNSGPHSMGLSF